MLQISGDKARQRRREFLELSLKAAQVPRRVGDFLLDLTG
jgi:hypothetical protein